MTLQEALNILRHYQLWRLGEEITELHPKVITQAIDIILNKFKNNKDTDDDRLSNFGSSFLAD